jgi:hypothetical protein
MEQIGSNWMDFPLKVILGIFFKSDIGVFSLKVILGIFFKSGIEYFL